MDGNARSRCVLVGGAALLIVLVEIMSLVNVISHWKLLSNAARVGSKTLPCPFNGKIASQWFPIVGMASTFLLLLWILTKTGALITLKAQGVKPSGEEMFVLSAFGIVSAFGFVLSATRLAYTSHIEVVYTSRVLADGST